MARLQKKKGASRKKKKPQVEAGAANAATQAGAAEEKGGLSLVREPARKPAPAPRRAPVRRKEPGKLRGTFETCVQFLREVKVELKKVTWPSRKQTMGSTAVVIVVVLIISFFLGIVDIGLSSLIQVVLQ